MPAVWAGLTQLRIALPLLAPIIVAVIIPDLVVLSTQGLSEADADRAIMLVAVYPLAMLFAGGAA